MQLYKLSRTGLESEAAPSAARCRPCAFPPERRLPLSRATPFLEVKPGRWVAGIHVVMAHRIARPSGVWMGRIRNSLSLVQARNGPCRTRAKRAFAIHEDDRVTIVEQRHQRIGAVEWGSA